MEEWEQEAEGVEGVEAEQKEKEEKNRLVERDTKGLKTTFVTYSFTFKHSTTRSHSYEL